MDTPVASSMESLRNPKVSDSSNYVQSSVGTLLNGRSWSLAVHGSVSAAGDCSIIDNRSSAVVVASGGDLEMIEAKARQLVECMNTNRNQDANILREFRAVLAAQARRTYAGIENNLFELYESQSRLIDIKVQLLFAIIKRIADLQKELDQFKQTLAVFCKELPE